MHAKLLSEKIFISASINAVKTKIYIEKSLVYDPILAIH